MGGDYYGYRLASPLYFHYGVGVIVEELRQGNTYKFDILNKAEENKEVDSE